MVDLVKPPFMKPCNGCGLCCKLELCGVAVMAMEETGDFSETLPCKYLVDSGDRYYCKIIQAENSLLQANPNAQALFSRALMIGEGCTMRDSDEEGEQAL